MVEDLRTAFAHIDSADQGQTRPAPSQQEIDRHPGPRILSEPSSAHDCRKVKALRTHGPDPPAPLTSAREEEIIEQTSHEAYSKEYQ